MNVYYTLDGSIPSDADTLYQVGDLFDISRVTVLRARAFDPAGLLQPSETITQTYLPNVYHAFPIVSVVSDPDELWNAEKGLLTVGPNVDKSKGIPFKNTIYREFGKIPRPGYVEMYLKDGTQLLNQGMNDAARALHQMGVEYVLITLGSRGAYASDGTTQRFDRPYPQRVVNTTGCGDAFTAATTLAVLEHRSLADILRMGLAAAAICSQGEQAVSDHMT